MKKAHSAKGKVIDFRSARTSAEAPVQVKATANASGSRGGFLDTWLKQHEDEQSLVQENLSLKEQQRRLEDERRELIPSISESVLYYAAIAFGLVMSVGWLIGSFWWSSM